MWRKWQLVIEIVAYHPPPPVEDGSSSLIYSFGERTEGGWLYGDWFGVIASGGAGGSRLQKTFGLRLYGAEVLGRGVVRMHVVAGWGGALRSS